MTGRNQINAGYQVHHSRVTSMALVNMWIEDMKSHTVTQRVDGQGLEETLGSEIEISE